MNTKLYPLFKIYNLAVLNWLKGMLTIPQYESSSNQFIIDKIIRRGTTGGGVNQHEIHLTNDTHNLKKGHIIKIEGSDKNIDTYSILDIVNNILVLNKRYFPLRGNEDFTSLPDEQKPKVKRAINVQYSSYERAFAEIIQPLRQGQNNTPAVITYIADYQYKVEKSRPRENYYIKRYKDNNGNKVGVAKVPPVQEYRLNYIVDIIAPTQQDMDYLQYQVITEFAPEKYFWISDKRGGKEYGLDYTGNRWNREFNGQWAHSLLESVSDLSEYEPGGSDRTLRTQIMFAINNAYLPLPFETDQPMIGSIDIETIIEE